MRGQLVETSLAKIEADMIPLHTHAADSYMVGSHSLA